MRMLAFSAFAAVTALASAGAGAQEPAPDISRADAVGALHQACVTSAEGLDALACACGAGVIAARADDRQLAALARLAPVFAEPDALEAAAEALIEGEGYGAQELHAAGQLMIAAQPLIDASCADLR